MKSETRFRQSTVIPFLNKLRHTIYITIQQLSKSGDPDVVLCIRGHFVALELKRTGGKTTRLQQYKLDQITEVGQGIAIIASPANWDQVKAWLTKLSEGEILNG